MQIKRSEMCLKCQTVYVLLMYFIGITTSITFDMKNGRKAEDLSEMCLVISSDHNTGQFGNTTGATTWRVNCSVLNHLQ